jgi:hypothetical protein
MAEPSPDKIVIGIVGSLIGAAVAEFDVPMRVLELF